MKKKFIFLFLFFIIFSILIGYWHIKHQEKIAFCSTVLTHDVDIIYDCYRLSNDDFSLQQHYDLFYRNAPFYSDLKKSAFFFDFIGLYSYCFEVNDCNVHDQNVLMNVMAQCALDGQTICMDSYLYEMKAKNLIDVIPDNMLISLNNILKTNDKQYPIYPDCLGYADYIKHFSDKQKKYIDKEILNICNKD